MARTGDRTFRITKIPRRRLPPRERPACDFGRLKEATHTINHRPCRNRSTHEAVSVRQPGTVVHLCRVHYLVCKAAGTVTPHRLPSGQ